MAHVTHKLKMLQQRRQALTGELATVVTEWQGLHDQMQKLRTRLIGVEREITECTTDTVVVSEHAMVRYMERVLGYDLDVLTAAILPEKILQQIQVVGSGEFPVESCEKKFVLIVRKNVVVTVEV